MKTLKRRDGRLVELEPDPDHPGAYRIKVYPVDFAACAHPPESVEAGPRSPLRWGSAPTEVCTRCGGHRLTDRWQTPWTPGPVDTTDDDDC